MSASRRQFIRRTCCTAAALGVASSFSRFGLINALAQATGQYRALVCIFLFGGNDANNMIVPYDSVGLRELPENSRLGCERWAGPGSIHSAADHHKDGASEHRLQSLRAAPTAHRSAKSIQLETARFLGQCGHALTTFDQNAVQQNLVSVPANLFSHSDQQEEWQTLALDGFAKTGWAGRMADKLQTLNAASSFPPITSVAGTAIFCTGQQTEPFAIIPSATGSTAQGLQDNALRHASRHLINFSHSTPDFPLCNRRAGSPPTHLPTAA